MDFANIIYYAGLSLLALGFVGGLLAVIFFRVKGKRLHVQLESEYGKQWRL